jgi:hypothetical protein
MVTSAPVRLDPVADAGGTGHRVKAHQDPPSGYRGGLGDPGAHGAGTGNPIPVGPPGVTCRP